jgi:hypothetical protein
VIAKEQGLVMCFSKPNRLRLLQLYQDNLHKLTLGLKVLGLGRTLYLLDLIVERLSFLVNLIRDSLIS